MKAKQNIIIQPTYHWRNERGTQKIPREKWQWKHDNPKPMGGSKAVIRGKIITIWCYPRKQINKQTKKSQVYNLTLHINQTEKREQWKSKISRRREIINVRTEVSEM